MATIEIAKSLKLHPFTVTRLAREGKLPKAASACPPSVVAGRFRNCVLRHRNCTAPELQVVEKLAQFAKESREQYTEAS